MIQISKPQMGKREINAVVSVLKSGHLIQGKKVVELEKQFAKLAGTKYAVAVSNGTAALHVALLAAGIKPGDEVITTPFTFVATANAILMAGAIPVFVDIDEKTYNINPTLIEKAITKKTRAILSVNLYGQPADYDAIRKIARRHNLIIIEDAAQSVNAQYKKLKSGNLGDIGTFSLYATKNVTCGEGGMITTNNKAYYMQSLLLRNHGELPGKKYKSFGLGYNYRLSDLHAAIAVEQMKKVAALTKKRLQNAKFYLKNLSNLKGLILPQQTAGFNHVFHQFTIRLTSKSPISRDQLKKQLEKKNIQTMIYYPLPLYTFSHLQQFGKKSHFPVTEMLTKEVLSLPIHPNLSQTELKYISSTIKKLLI